MVSCLYAFVDSCLYLATDYECVLCILILLGNLVFFGSFFKSAVVWLPLLRARIRHHAGTSLFVPFPLEVFLILRGLGICCGQNLSTLCDCFSALDAICDTL